MIFFRTINIFYIIFVSYNCLPNLIKLACSNISFKAFIVTTPASRIRTSLARKPGGTRVHIVGLDRLILGWCWIRRTAREVYLKKQEVGRQGCAKKKRRQGSGSSRTLESEQFRSIGDH
jgi:hypothetical protein